MRAGRGSHFPPDADIAKQRAAAAVGLPDPADVLGIDQFATAAMKLERAMVVAFLMNQECIAGAEWLAAEIAAGRHLIDNPVAKEATH